MSNRRFVLLYRLRSEYLSRWSIFSELSVRNLTINVPVVLHGCQIWSLTVREEGRQRVFINRVLRRIFRPKRDEVTGNGEDYITKSFMLCTPHQLSFG